MDNYCTTTLKHIESEWLILSELGKGSFGSVFKAKKLNGMINGESVDICAIKKINKVKLKDQDIKNFKNEIDVLNKLKGGNKYMINYYGYGEDENERLYIYMEYIEGAISISDKLERCCAPEKRFDEKDIMIITNKLIQALQTIHSNQIIHRDIKGENILLVNGNDLDIKIIDFGLSKLYNEEGSKFNTFVGTLSHVAPEVVFQKKTACRKSDIWSLGCTIIEMTGSSLERENGKPVIPSFLSSFTLKNIIQDCLIDNVSGRIDLDTLSKRMTALLLKKGLSSDLKYPFTIPIEEMDVDFDSITKMLDQLSINYEEVKSPQPPSIEVTTSMMMTSSPPASPDLSIISNGSKSIYKKFLKLGSMLNRTKSNPGLESLEFISETEYSSLTKTLKPGLIPSSVTSINLSSYNKKLLPGSIPPHVTSINLSSYNKKITLGSIPSSVTKLKLSSFNQQIEIGSIPSSVTSLYLPLFNKLIPYGTIPSGITTLDLTSYNQPILPGSIPSSVTKIKFPSFNQQIEIGSIPASVTSLYLPLFNKSIILGTIPSSISTLDLASYNQSLEIGSMPTSVTVLKLSSFNQILEIGSIPSSVIRLKLSSYNKKIIPQSIPTSVTVLKLSSFNQPIGQLSIPTSVTSLSFYEFNQKIEYGEIPDSVTMLDLGKRFNIQEDGDDLPDETLVKLISRFEFQKPINQKYIPRSVSKLELPNYNLQLNKNSISNSISHLTLGYDFTNLESLSYLPPSVISLKFGYTGGIWNPELQKKYISNTITSLIVNDTQKNDSASAIIRK